MHKFFWLGLLASLCARASARQLFLDNVLLDELAGFAWPGGGLEVEGELVLGVPSHGCWVDNTTLIRDKIVLLTNDDPTDAWWRRCSLQQRVLAQSGARAVLIGLRGINTTNEPLVIDVWQALPREGAPLLDFAWQRLANALAQQAGGARPTVRLEKASFGERAQAQERWRGNVAYTCVMTTLFAGAFVASLIETLRRPRKLGALSFGKILREDVSFHVLWLTSVSALWKLVSVAPFTLAWLVPSLSWPGFVWLSDLGDIFLYEALAIFLYSWSRVLSTLEARRAQNVILWPTRLFVVLYGLASLATLVLGSLSPAGALARASVLLAAMLYLCAFYIYVGAALITRFRARAESAANLLSVFVAVVVVAIALNAVLVALAIAGLTSLLGNFLASVADLAILLTLALFFLNSERRQETSARSTASTPTANTGRQRPRHASVESHISALPE